MSQDEAQKGCGDIVSSQGELQRGGVKQRYYSAKGGGGSKVGWQVAKLQTPSEGVVSAVVV